MPVAKPRKSSSPKVKTKKNYLVDYGVVTSSSKSAAVDLLLTVQPTLGSIPYNSASKYVDYLWKELKTQKKFKSTLSGNLFELIIACVLIQEGILPFYWQAEMEFVPLAIFDLMVYTEEIGPVVLSLKTSLRERYKQAEFEAQALKSVHRLARTFLVTMDTPGEVSRVNLEIKQGVISGMNGVVIANRVEFDKVVKDIKSWGVIMAPSVPLVTGGKKVDRRKVLP